MTIIQWAGFAPLLTSLSLPALLAGQHRPPPALGIPVLSLAEAFELVQEAEPLPILDDAGNPITRQEIAARMRTGKGGGILGGVLGTLLGGVAGIALGLSQCDFWDECSPRDEAMSGVLVLAGIGWGGTLGYLVGQELGEVDRFEAIEQIRRERSATTPGGPR